MVQTCEEYALSHNLKFSESCQVQDQTYGILQEAKGASWTAALWDPTALS
jgi:hypothetical protein